jgi:hypothetical protein
VPCGENGHLVVLLDLGNFGTAGGKEELLAGAPHDPLKVKPSRQQDAQHSGMKDGDKRSVHT